MLRQPRGLLQWVRVEKDSVCPQMSCSLFQCRANAFLGVGKTPPLILVNVWGSGWSNYIEAFGTKREGNIGTGVLIT
jgi:hypothetical protein